MILRYTGHPLLDVGIAGLVAFAGRQRPEELTEADLEAAADYMAANYTVQPLRSYLSNVFMNADGFTQAAYSKDTEKQLRYADLVLRSFRIDTPTLDEIDPFLGLPVADISFNVKDELPSGRTDRRHIPLQTGVGIINFHPEGSPGLPVSGATLLGFQALPLGSAKCEGKLLAVHSDNPDLMLDFAASFLQTNRTYLHIAHQTGSTKLGESSFKQGTLLVKTLLEARDMQLTAQTNQLPFTITAYHLGSGQKPYLNIYHLPSQVILYLKKMLRADYAPSWNKLVYAAWDRAKLKASNDTTDEPKCNRLYEDLFGLAHDPVRAASRFIRTYFLRRPLIYKGQDNTDPRAAYSTRTEANLVSWHLTAPFLRSILNMQEERIKQIQSLGDSLAGYIFEENERTFYREFYSTMRFDHLRVIMLRADRKQTAEGRPPLFTLYQFLTVFEQEGRYSSDYWRLARDLVFIRMIERLYEMEWIQQQGDPADGSNVDDEPDGSLDWESSTYSEENQ